MCVGGCMCANGVQCGGLNARDDIGVCVPAPPYLNCSIVDQNCPEGEGCYVVQGEELCVVPNVDAAGLNEPCVTANGCEIGLVCLGMSADVLTCLQPCAVGGDTCPDGETCVGTNSDNAGVSGVCFGQ